LFVGAAEQFRRRGGVDDHVQPAEGLDRGGDRGANLILAADVGGDEAGPAAPGDDLLGDAMPAVAGAADAGHGRSLVGEPLGDRRAHAAGGPGDQGDASAEGLSSSASHGGYARFFANSSSMLSGPCSMPAGGVSAGMAVTRTP